MAATKSAKNPTAHNDTPNTPDVRESAIAKMKVDELRRKLRGHGVKDTADLKKPELVKKLIKAEVAETKSGATKSTSGAKKSTSASTKKSTSAAKAPAKSGSKDSASKKSASKNPTPHNDTPNTPDVSESAIAAMKADDLRRKLRGHGVKGTAELKKPELVKRLIEVEVSTKKKSAKSGGTAKAATGTKPGRTAKAATDTKATAGTKPAKSGRATKNVKDIKVTKSGTDAKSGRAVKDDPDTRGATSGTIRTGKKASSSLKYSQEITSTKDKPERAGRSLVTTDHEVIRQWAKARKAVPATVGGTEHDGHLGVLRFDFPGYSGDRLTPVEWDEWLGTFDKRRLNFIYQQRQSNGKRSNFFRLENPDE